MTAGQIALVDWRDAIQRSGEPNKRRPVIVVSSPRLFGTGLPFEIVVPLTSEAARAIEGASLRIEPTPQNGCTTPCYALAWQVQTVPHVRLAETPSHITANELTLIRLQIAACVDVIFRDAGFTRRKTVR